MIQIPKSFPIMGAWTRWEHQIFSPKMGDQYHVQYALYLKITIELHNRALYFLWEGQYHILKLYNPHNTTLIKLENNTHVLKYIDVVFFLHSSVTRRDQNSMPPSNLWNTFRDRVPLLMERQGVTGQSEKKSAAAKLSIWSSSWRIEQQGGLDNHRWSVQTWLRRPNLTS